MFTLSVQLFHKIMSFFFFCVLDILGPMGVDTMDVDYNPDQSDNLGSGLDEVELKRFLRTATQSFYKQYGLLSHQLNSYNEFIRTGIQEVFNSIGEILVKPLYDSSQYGDGEWRSASVKFGKVTLEQPKFYTGENFSMDDGDCFVDMLPRHARLQNMTYAARMKVQVNFKVLLSGESTPTNTHVWFCAFLNVLYNHITIQCYRNL